MTFLWFNEDVNLHERKRVQLDLQPKLVWTPFQIHGDTVRATLEISLEKRPWNNAQAVFVCAMREIARLPEETFDMRWVPTGIRVSVNSAAPGSSPVLSQLASLTIGATWVLNRERFNSFALRFDVGLLQTLLDDA